MIKAITYDFWATLYKGKTPKYEQRILGLKTALEQHSQTTFSIETFTTAVDVGRVAWRKAWEEEYRTIGAEEWLEIILRQLDTSLNVTIKPKIVTFLQNTVLKDLPTLAPNIKTVLAKLSTHYQLGIISDTGLTPGTILHQVLEQDGIAQYFSHFTFSDQLGHSKPHPQAFLSTLAALNANLQQAVHVGDLLRTDIAGAKSLGIRAVQYIGISQDEPSNIKPDAIISNHTELEPLLLEWNNLKE